MAREDKGNVMSSYEENNKGGEEQPSSLSARRARLRGSLAKAMPDPYSVASANQGAPNVAGVTAEPSSEPGVPEENFAASAPAVAPTLPSQAQATSPDNGNLNGNPVMNQNPTNGNASAPIEPQAVPPPVLTNGGGSSAPGGAPSLEYSPPSSGVSDLASAITQASDDAINASLADLGVLPEPDSASSALAVDAPATVSPRSSFVGLPSVQAPPMPFMPDLPVVSPPPMPLMPDLPPTNRIVSFSTNDSQTLDLLGSMDQAMNICAMNLSSMQKAASEQTDALKILSDTLKNQTFSELGLSLNSLMESLSAALEPMKAVGELVPAIDQLVSAFESKNTQTTEPRLNSEQLVISLGDQLSSGAIDAWTFKCAYTAIFPVENPADLLHRLVDLLSNQKISGEVFRLGYDAVQSAEAPPLPLMPRRRRQEGEEGEEVSVIHDDALLAEIEQLRLVQEDLQRKDKLREEELAALVSSKEKELYDAQEQLNERWQEFSSRYEELTDTLKKRDESLHERESELAQRSTQLQQKDTENQVLKHQIEELREQTQEMVKELQKQLNDTRLKQEEMKSQPAKPAPGFFDVAPGQEQPPTLFDNGPARPLFQQQMNQAKAEAQRETGPQTTLNNPGQLNSANGQPQEAPKPQQPQMGSPNPVPVNQQAMPQMPQPQGQPQIQPQNQPHMQPPAQPHVQQGPPQGMQQQPNQGPISQQIPQPPPQNGQMPVSNQAIPTTPPQGQLAQQQMPRPPVPGPNTFVPGSGSYGTGVRAQVFEVIVRQALAGAPWKEICAGPMQVNNISPDEVEQEVKRRQALLKK